MSGTASSLLPAQLPGCLLGSSWESPRFPLKGSFKGDIDTSIDIDVDMDIDSDMAVSISWRSFKGVWGSFWVDVRLVKS